MLDFTMFAGGQMTTINYLESLDSVRVPWDELKTSREKPFAYADWLVKELEVLFEIIGTLAFTSRIVVPSTYAWDSLLFLKAGAEVLHARDTALKDRASEGTGGAYVDRPFCMNLGADQRFIDEMTRRMRAADGTAFVSSAFPELHDATASRRNNVADSLIRGDTDALADLTAVALIDDAPALFPRHTALEVVIKEFASDSVHVTYKQGPNVNTLLHQFVRSAPQMLGTISPSYSKDTLGMIVDRVSRILDRVPEVNNRSIFRSWGNMVQLGNRTFEEFAGGPAEAGTIREFADSLYNMVLFRSTPASAATFITELSGSEVPDYVREARAIAQDLAVAIGLDGVSAVAEPTGSVSDDETRLAGFFVRAPRKIHSENFSELLDIRRRLVAGLSVLMRQRADGSSDIWRGINSIETAAARLRREPAQYDRLQRALELQKRVVASVIGSHVAVETTGIGRLSLKVAAAVGGSAGGAGAVASWVSNLPVWVTGIISSAAPAPWVAVKVGRRLAIRGEEKFWRQCLSKSIVIPGNE